MCELIDKYISIGRILLSVPQKKEKAGESGISQQRKNVFSRFFSKAPFLSIDRHFFAVV